MVITVQIKLKPEENVAGIIRKFFEELNPASKLTATETVVEMEISFEKIPPLALLEEVTKMSSYTISYFQLNEGEEILKENKTANPEVQKKSKTTTIPELEEIAKDSENIKDFCERVAKKYPIPEYQDIWEEYIKIVTVIENVNWTEIDYTVAEKGIEYKTYTRARITNQFTEKYSKQVGCKIFEFLKYLSQYRNYEFKANNPETIVTKRTIQLECIPIEFTVEKDSCIEKKINNLVEKMEETQKITPKEKKRFIEAVSAQVKKEGSITAIQKVVIAEYLLNFSKDNRLVDIDAFCKELKEKI